MSKRNEWTGGPVGEDRHGRGEKGWDNAREVSKDAEPTTYDPHMDRYAIGHDEWPTR